MGCSQSCSQGFYHALRHRGGVGGGVRGSMSGYEGGFKYACSFWSSWGLGGPPTNFFRRGNVCLRFRGQGARRKWLAWLHSIFFRNMYMTSGQFLPMSRLFHLAFVYFQETQVIRRAAHGTTRPCARPKQCRPICKLYTELKFPSLQTGNLDALQSS